MASSSSTLYRKFKHILYAGEYKYYPNELYAPNQQYQFIDFNVFEPTKTILASFSRESATADKQQSSIFSNNYNTNNSEIQNTINNMDMNDSKNKNYFDTTCNVHTSDLTLMSMSRSHAYFYAPMLNSMYCISDGFPWIAENDVENIEKKHCLIPCPPQVKQDPFVSIASSNVNTLLFAITQFGKCGYMYSHSMNKWQAIKSYDSMLQTLFTQVNGNMQLGDLYNNVAHSATTLKEQYELQIKNEYNKLKAKLNDDMQATESIINSLTDLELKNDPLFTLASAGDDLAVLYDSFNNLLLVFIGTTVSIHVLPITPVPESPSPSSSSSSSSLVKDSSQNQTYYYRPIVKQLCCGGKHYIAIDQYNNAFVFGDNSDSQLGIDMKDNEIQHLTRFAGNVRLAAAGLFHSVIVTMDHKVYTW